MKADTEEFLRHGTYAVVGASNDRDKYGNKVLRKLKECGLKAYPVNPNETQVEGETCYPELKDLPETVDGVVFVVPPKVTETVVRQLPEQGIKRIWMQPGAQSKQAEEFCENEGISCISRECILVRLNQR